MSGPTFSEGFSDGFWKQKPGQIDSEGNVVDSGDTSEDDSVAETMPALNMPPNKIHVGCHVWAPILHAVLSDDEDEPILLVVPSNAGNANE